MDTAHILLQEIMTRTRVPRDYLHRTLRRTWRRMPPSVVESAPMLVLGAAIHRRSRARQQRGQSPFTRFLRSRGQLEVLRDIVRSFEGQCLRLAVVGCSTGAEVYSAAYVVKSTRPDLDVAIIGLDLDADVVCRARQGVYAMQAPEVAWLSSDESAALFDERDGALSVKPWIRRGIAWTVADARQPPIAMEPGAYHVLLVNNLLIHMDTRAAESCLRTLARLVAPNGSLFVSGMDLDLKTRLLPRLGFSVVPNRIEEIHNRDSKRLDWPWSYWGLEPLDRSRPDWESRYGTVYRLARTSAHATVVQ
jgi:hypothetical protein